MDSNLGRGAGVKKTRSVFSPRASPPAGGRSRCGSAKRMRGILYAAPIELEASGNGGFSFMPPLHGFEPQSRRERLNHHFVKFSKLSLDPSRGHVHNNPCVAALPQLDRGSDYESERHRFESYTPHQLSFKPPETGVFPLRGHCGDSNLVRGASVKKTRSVFSERASPPTGGRSRCGSAQRMRGILYAAPIEF